jgi:hypothetical protein
MGLGTAKTLAYFLATSQQKFTEGNVYLLIFS